MKSNQRARDQSDFVIPSEPKIIRLVIKSLLFAFNLEIYVEDAGLYRACVRETLDREHKCMCSSQKNLFLTFDLKNN